jgi:hypothetical protein
MTLPALDDDLGFDAPAAAADRPLLINPGGSSRCVINPEGGGR